MGIDQSLITLFEDVLLRLLSGEHVAASSRLTFREIAYGMRGSSIYSSFAPSPHYNSLAG